MFLCFDESNIELILLKTKLFYNKTKKKRNNPKITPLPIEQK